MKFQKIQLSLSENETKSIKNSFEKTIHKLERVRPFKGGFSYFTILSQLQVHLTDIIGQNEHFSFILEEISKSGAFHHVNLCHPDVEVLNLPWGISLDPFSKRPLNEIPQLLMSKNNLITAPEEIKLTGGPLKILIMISSPKDVTIEGRLNYEEEEHQLLSAFEPLLKVVRCR